MHSVPPTNNQPPSNYQIQNHQNAYHVLYQSILKKTQLRISEKMKEKFQEGLGVMGGIVVHAKDCCRRIPVGAKPSEDVTLKLFNLLESLADVVSVKELKQRFQMEPRLLNDIVADVYEDVQKETLKNKENVISNFPPVFDKVKKDLKKINRDIQFFLNQEVDRMAHKIKENHKYYHYDVMLILRSDLDKETFQLMTNFHDQCIERGTASPALPQTSNVVPVKSKMLR